MRIWLASMLVLGACSSTGRPTGPQGSAGAKADGSSCPVEGADQTLDAIERAGSCGVAADLAEACAWGSSIDVQFVAAATAVCDRGFDAMPPAARAAYDSLRARCGEKYAAESGTLYRSMAAFCALEVTRLHATLYPEPDYAEPAVSVETTCPVDSDPAAIEHAIERASSCGSAADIAMACAWGSSVDVQLAAAASAVCIDETGTPMGEDAKLYDQLLAACDALYTEGSGTLQLSVAAMCRLQVDVVFNGLAAEVE